MPDFLCCHGRKGVTVSDSDSDGEDGRASSALHSVCGFALGYQSDSSSSSGSSEDSQWCSLNPCRNAKFHLVPKNGWHPFLKRMECDAANTIKWFGKGPVPTAPDDCWLLPASDEMAVCIAELQWQLLGAGWKLLTCAPQVVSKLSNKARLHDHAKECGLLGSLPQHYTSPDTAKYPCVLKAAVGHHGKDVFIVQSKAEVHKIAQEGFGSQWVLQELISGHKEYSVSMLVEHGEILDAICTEYKYDKKEYVWPNVGEVGRKSHSDIPREHLATMQAFLREYSGICNFNYKVRKSGSLCVFEINTRVGADLACDVPRPRARALFEKLDALAPTRSAPQVSSSASRVENSAHAAVALHGGSAQQIP